MTGEGLRLSHSIRWRREYFGVFAWTVDRGEFFRIEGLDAAVLGVIALSGDIARQALYPSVLSDAGFAASPEAIQESANRLLHAGLLVRTGHAAGAHSGVGSRYLESAPAESVAKPVWVHLQPFTFCNLSCIHCYCDSSPQAPRFRRSPEDWCKAIAAFDDYGIADVYLTGGETLIVPEVWTLVREISARKMGTGLSTNALHVSPGIIDNLQRFEIRTIQVSLDGGTAKTHDWLRNKRGAFEQTLRNIEAIAKVSEPVINTTVNRANLSELREIVRLGQALGVRKFKFYPQKATGRAALLQDLTLSDAEIVESLRPLCASIARETNTRVETVDPAARCGSAWSGFSVDALGDAFPCIFGIGAPSQRAGNVFDQDIDDVWFQSPVMRRFRTQDESPCRRCEFG